MTTLARLQRWLIAVLVFGLSGTLVELLLLSHYEDAWQFAPLVLIVLAFAALAWLSLRPTVRSVRTVQAVMMLFLIAGVAGAVLHMRGAAEFQLEIDRSMPRRQLVTKVLRAQSPPPLAPGVMTQMGLVGLLAVYRHPALKGRDA